MGFGGSGRCGEENDVGKAFKDLEFCVSVFLLTECRSWSCDKILRIFSMGGPEADDRMCAILYEH